MFIYKAECYSSTKKLNMQQQMNLKASHYVKVSHKRLQYSFYDSIYMKFLVNTKLKGNSKSVIARG